MPRNGSGVYSKPAGTTAVPNTLIESAKYNETIDDLVADANAARPITAGGTGATSKSDAATALEVVSYGSAQTLTAAQQAQVRSNISAALNGQIYGLTLSNNVTDVTNDIDIASGEAASTETNPVLMALSSTLTKRLDAAWAVGSGNGGRDTGSIADGTWHIWLIQRSDTGVVDALFSLSASSPTMPSGYDRKRRIGSIIRISGAIKPFSQRGDEFLWQTPSLDVNVTNLGLSTQLYGLVVPIGIQVEAIINGLGVNSVGSWYILITSLDQANLPASSSQYTACNAVNFLGPFFKRVRTNTSGQIRAIASINSTTFQVTTDGYIDTRGRLA